MKRVAMERVILRLNIPSLQNHSMSLCNIAKTMNFFLYCIYSDTSANTSNLLLLLFFEVTTILGLFMTSLYLRLITVFIQVSVLSLQRPIFLVPQAQVQYGIVMNGLIQFALFLQGFIFFLNMHVQYLQLIDFLFECVSQRFLSINRLLWIR